MKTSVIYHNFLNLYNWQEEWLAGVWDFGTSWGPFSLISMDKLNPLEIVLNLARLQIYIGRYM